MFTGKGYLLYKLRRWLLPLIIALPLLLLLGCCIMDLGTGLGPSRPTFREDMGHFEGESLGLYIVINVIVCVMGNDAALPKLHRIGHINQIGDVYTRCRFGRCVVLLVVLHFSVSLPH